MGDSIVDTYVKIVIQWTLANDKELENTVTMQNTNCDLAVRTLDLKRFGEQMISEGHFVEYIWTCGELFL